MARKVYSNVYLFDKQNLPLQIQKNGRELEIIVQECIMTTIRDSIPTEDIIRAYMDESVEHEEEVTFEPIVLPKTETEETVENKIEKEDTLSDSIMDDMKPDVVTRVGIKNMDEKEVTTRL